MKKQNIGLLGIAFNSPAVIVLMTDRTKLSTFLITHPPEAVRLLQFKQWLEQTKPALEKVVLFTKLSIIKLWLKEASFRATKIVVFETLDRLIYHKIPVLDAEYHKSLKTYVRYPVSQLLLNTEIQTLKTFKHKPFKLLLKGKSKVRVRRSVPASTQEGSLEYFLHELQKYLSNEDFQAFSFSCFSALAGLTRRGPFRSIKKICLKASKNATVRVLINKVNSLVDKNYKTIFLAMAVLAVTKKSKLFAIRFSECDAALLHSILVRIQPTPKLVFSYKVPKRVLKLA